MSRWRYRDGDDADDLEKFAKIRSKKKPRAKVSDQNEVFELDEAEWSKLKEPDLFAARVVEVHKRYAFVSSEPQIGHIKTRDVWLATIAKTYLTEHRNERNFICVGDRVLCRPAREQEVQINQDLPQSVIIKRTPRHAKIQRIDPSFPGRIHVLACNVDQLLIVASYRSPKIKWGLIDRFLVLAESERIEPIILLNKRDLLESEGDAEFKAECAQHVQDYRALGYQVYSLQLNAGRRDPDVKALQQALTDKVSMVTGHSGVGKSSLVNLCKPEIEQDVEPDADIFYKGRHTTSFASLIRLGTGGYLVDTPGIRSFAIEERGAIELSHCFREMRPLLGKCQFRECKHWDEPNCKVREAVQEGGIAGWRYRSYLSILSGATGREGRLREIEVDEG